MESDEIKLELQTAIAETSGLTHHGKPLVTFKNDKDKDHVDWGAFGEKFKDVITAYTTQVDWEGLKKDYAPTVAEYTSKVANPTRRFLPKRVKT